MNCVYLANVVIDPIDILERDPVCAEAGRLRAMELLDLLSESSLFQNIYLISQGRGRKRGRYRTCLADNGAYAAVYLPVLAYSAFLRNLTGILLTGRWLLRHVKKGDVVITYNHDPMKAIPVLLTWPILRFRLIVQLEELYRGLGPKYLLHRVFEGIGARLASGFIVSNKGIVQALGLGRDGRALAVASGYGPVSYSHRSEQFRDANAPITLLYAGNLDEARGIRSLIEAFMRVKCPARLLITGRGVLKPYVEEIGDQHSNIAYMGMLPETDFAQLLQSVDVCINPQPRRHRFTDSSFPSKVVNYLAHGKPVISTKTSALLNSPYESMLMFYDGDGKSLDELLSYVTNNRQAIRTKARSYPDAVRQIKDNEKADVLEVLHCVSCPA